MRSILLWVAAFVFMAAASVYQRATGPTYPKRGEIVVAGESYRYALVRSQETTAQARVALPQPGPGTGGFLVYRRYPTEDDFTTAPLVVEEGEDGSELAGYLPVQPAAGKIEYRLELDVPEGRLLVPKAGVEDETIVLRYKDPVPGALLASHVIAMFFTVLVGMRAGLGAVFSGGGVRLAAWTTLAGMTTGGLILGPLVQKYAFGAYWTGFPLGYDLTDNKLLVMWAVWLVACLVLGLPGRRTSGAGVRAAGAAGRVAVLAAALVMTVVYLIPHSMRGSELDYGRVDQGTPPSEAVGTGRI